ncbi:hypothetical protein C0966_11365 [Bacillus methanolicus]|uniref:hypothetical protein n=1 Tax=Bacillus methanolicus TaxID=1471 RepID=UPI0023809B7E|nr:hypothetical protein [Bacillus methanolicus]MDE3839958.1 hypothetical protein [Bacillus methanolicus]
MSLLYVDIKKAGYEGNFPIILSDIFFLLGSVMLYLGKNHCFPPVNKKIRRHGGVFYSGEKSDSLYVCDCNRTDSLFHINWLPSHKKFISLNGYLCPHREKYF